MALRQLRSSIAFIHIILSGLALIWSIPSLSDPAQSEQQLLTLVKQAYQNNDVEAAYKLFNSQGVSPSGEEQIRDNLTQSMQKLAGEINQISFDDSAPVFPKEWVREDVRYRMNVEQLGTIRVEYQVEGVTGSISWAYGESQSRYYLAAYSEQSLDNSGTPNQLYSVVMNAEQGVTLKGYCEFTASGIEQLRDVAGKGSIALNIEAQQIKLCKVIRTTGKGAVGLVISRITSTDPLEYDKLFDERTCPLFSENCSPSELEWQPADG